MKFMAVPEVEALKPYAPPLGDRESTFNLDFNEWAGSEQPRLGEVARSFPLELIRRYPEAGRAKLKVAQQLGVSAANIQLANGTDEAFCNVYRSYVAKGDSVLIPDPGYPMMVFYATLCGATILNWDLPTPQSAYDSEAAIKALGQGVKCLTIGRPNNPTGTFIDGETVCGWADSFEDSLILVDEAYIDFGGESLAQEATQRANLMVLRTFSKAWGLAGMRLGAVVASESNIATLAKMWSPYSVNAVGLYLLENLLPDNQWATSVREQIDQERERLKSELDKRGLKTSFAYGNFFMIDFGADHQKVVEGFAVRNIRLRDQSSKTHLEGWVRVTIGDAQATDRFLDALDEVLK